MGKTISMETLSSKPLSANGSVVRKREYRQKRLRAAQRFLGVKGRSGSGFSGSEEYS